MQICKSLIIIIVWSLQNHDKFGLYKIMLSFSRELNVKLRTIEANRAPAKNGHHASLVSAPYYLKFPGGLTTENMNFFPPAQKACPSVRVCNKVYHRFYAGLYILIKKLVLFWFAFNRFQRPWLNIFDQTSNKDNMMSLLKLRLWK